jgi:WD40 repeat protein
MLADHPIDDLLLLWEDARQRGEALRAEDLCREHPELLPEVQRRITALEAVYRVLNADETGSHRSGDQDTEPDTPLSSPFPSLPGYAILAELGHGGMGIVYRARQVSAGREVALKMIRAGQLASPAEVERFRTEAETVALLDHPHIVPVYEVGEHQHQHFFSMKLVEGGNLAEHLDRFRADPRLAAALVVTVARAVQYAHERGVLHRDLKPSNILLGAPGEPLVTDFGLAKRLEGPAGTQTGAVLGTPSYMAPEQAAGQSKRVTTAVDVYALGAILYELLTGRPPFRGETPLHTLQQVLHDEPAPPSHLQPAVPTDLETICLKCLRKDPVARYAGAGALAEDLERFRAGEPIQARAVGAGERLVKWVRRNPAPAALIALAVAAGVALAAGGWWYFYREHQYALSEHQHALRETDLRGEADAKRDEARTAETKARSAEAKAADERDAALLNLYVLRTNRAQREWEAGNCGPMLDLLEACRPRAGEKDLRGFEWYYLWNLSHGARLTLTGHEGWVAGVAWSPDGRYLASVSTDATVRLWDASTGKELRVLKGHSDEPFVYWTVAFGRDGTRFATALAAPASGSSEVRIWETATGREAGTVAIPGVIRGLAFSADDRHLVTAVHFKQNPPQQQALIQSWSPAGKLERSVPVITPGPVLMAALSPDGRRLAWEVQVPNGERNLFVWETATGHRLLTLQGASRGVGLRLQFSPDGRRLARADSAGMVDTWDLSTETGGPGEPANVPAQKAGGGPMGPGTDPPGVGLIPVPLTTVKHRANVGGLAFSPDATRLVCSDANGTVTISNATTGAVLHVLKGHRSGVTGAVFSPDGQQLATAGSDGTVKVWDAGTGPAGDPASPQWSFRASPGPRGKFSPDGQRLGLFSPRGRLWEITTGRQLHPPARGSWGAFSPDGRRIALQDERDVTIRDLTTGRSVFWGEPPPVLRIRAPVPRSISCLAFSPDGRLLARGTTEPVVEVWDVSRENGELVAPRSTLNCGGNGVYEVMFSPDSRRLVTVGWDATTLKIWDVSSAEGAVIGAPVLTIKCGRITKGEVAFSPDGTRLAVATANDFAVCIWDVATARGEIAAPVLRLRGHTAAVAGLSWSPDGARLASGSLDKTVKLWEVLTGQELLTLRAHTFNVSGVAFSRDGQRLTSVGQDGTVNVWEAVPPSRELLLQRTATRLVDSLFSKWGEKERVLAHLRRDTTLSEPLRREALLYAEGRRTRADSWE